MKFKDARKWTGLVLLSCLVFMLPNIGMAQSGEDLRPYVESHPDGKIDWKNGMVYGTGKGYLDVNGGSKDKALRAARVIALQSILKVLAGVRIDDKRTLETLQKDKVVIELKALIRYDIFETKFIQDARPHFEVICQAPIKGVQGLTAKLLDQLRQKELPWPQGFPIQPIKGGTKTDEGDEENWLILFAGHLTGENRIRPALFPQIVTPSGEELYDIKQVDEEALKESGTMVQYVVSSKGPKDFRSGETHLDRFLSGLKSIISPNVANAEEDKKKREKRQRFIVKTVQEAEGLMKTNLLINEKDAKELKQNETAGQILKKCRVIVVVNSPIGGIEGSIPHFTASLQ